MTRRKARLGDEDRAHKAPPEGPEVFQPQRERPHALIKVKPLPGHEEFIRVRWPASTARRGPVDPPVEREIIDLEGRQKLSRPLPDDPYKLDQIFPQSKQGQEVA